MLCLLDDVILGVQTPREEPLEEATARSFLVVLARKIKRHLTMKWPLSFFYCSGYSYRWVANDVLNKSL